MFRFVLFVFFCVIPLCASARKYYDAAAFDLVGHVRYMLTSTGRISFKEDGSLDKANSTALSEYKKYAISRSKDGYPVKIVTDFETILLEYDDTHKLTKKTVRGTSNYTITYSREYSAEKLYIQEEALLKLDGSGASTTKRYGIKIDSRNNWTWRKEYNAPEVDKETRWMAYWINNKYERADADIDLLLALSVPLGIDGFGKMKLKDIKREIKARKLTYKLFASQYTFENYGGTYYGYNVIPNFYCNKKTSPWFYKLIINLPTPKGAVHDELIAMMIDELAEQGYEVKHKDGALKFVYNGYNCVLGYNNYPYGIYLMIDYKY